MAARSMCCRHLPVGDTLKAAVCLVVDLEVHQVVDLAVYQVVYQRLLSAPLTGTTAGCVRQVTLW